MANRKLLLEGQRLFMHKHKLPLPFNWKDILVEKKLQVLGKKKKSKQNLKMRVKLSSRRSGHSADVALTFCQRLFACFSPDPQDKLTLSFSRECRVLKVKSDVNLK
uniref:PPUP9237 n=1 Tax=Poeciliopsis prolifica TaxID=188132 RepID=A0A0S7EQT3_9TELE